MTVAPGVGVCVMVGVGAGVWLGSALAVAVGLGVHVGAGDRVAVEIGAAGIADGEFASPAIDGRGRRDRWDRRAVRRSGLRAGRGEEEANERH